MHKEIRKHINQFLVALDGVYDILPVSNANSYSIGLTNVEYNLIDNKYTVYCRRPGLLIGKAGQNINKLKKHLDSEIVIKEIQIPARENKNYGVGDLVNVFVTHFNQSGVGYIYNTDPVKPENGLLVIGITLQNGGTITMNIDDNRLEIIDKVTTISRDKIIYILQWVNDNFSQTKFKDHKLNPMLDSKHMRKDFTDEVYSFEEILNKYFEIYGK